MYLDGSYPLGSISASSPVVSLNKEISTRTFVAHRRVDLDSRSGISLLPSVLHLPMLQTRHTRDMAQLSSTARELIWYTIRVVQDMKQSWVGTDSQPGARSLGPKWIRALEGKQKDHGGCKLNLRNNPCSLLRHKYEL
jgi:anaphase-promoting complex subunit 4